MHYRDRLRAVGAGDKDQRQAIADRSEHHRRISRKELMGKRGLRDYPTDKKGSG